MWLLMHKYELYSNGLVICSKLNHWHLLRYLFFFILKYLRIGFRLGVDQLLIELTTLSSANHFEMSPSDVGFQDRYIVQEIIIEMAKNRRIDTEGKKKDLKVT